MANMLDQKRDSYLFGSNASFIEELYESYLQDSNSVDEKWQKYFATIKDSNAVFNLQIQDKFAAITQNPQAFMGSGVSNEQLQVNALVNAYRSVGHICAKLDPLMRNEIVKVNELKAENYGLNLRDSTKFEFDYAGQTQSKSLGEIIKTLEDTYCGNAGFEYIYLTDQKQRVWLQNYIEQKLLSYSLTKDEQKQILNKLTQADGLERYLQTHYVGQKRFSLEGGDSLIPMLDRLVSNAAKDKIDQVFIGMAHRGRLNTLVNLLGKTPQKLFDEFESKYQQYDFLTGGDVKYHKGAKCNYQTLNGKVKLTLPFNPSHLEVVNPVLNGMVRSAQDQAKDSNKILGVLIHGDSALIGLGTNQGTFNMSQTNAYGVGGMIHIVVNNQVGFTTSDIADNRSSRYCTDIAKMIDAPIIHVNGDDLDKVSFAIDLALVYRNTFKRDIVIDLVCFRRYGHNEGDDPTLTQPFMYKKIKAHPGIRKLYAQKLADQGIISLEDSEKMAEDYRIGLTKGEHIEAKRMQPLSWYDGIDIEPFLKASIDDEVKTSIDSKTLKQVMTKLTSVPKDFTLHPTISKLMDTRKSMAEGTVGFDFGMAELLAYGSLLNQGTSVRLSGEDSGRGTFSHRQAVFHDINGDDSDRTSCIPLKSLENKSQCQIFDSVLNEECVLGFEYGYSLERLNGLVIWEAQFGDFANGAQVMIDQFIASGEAKWGVINKVALMLPHGMDGQGPEHSSARVERFLQLAAENNLHIVMPSTAGQIFHLLRFHALSNWVKPLVVCLPKRLLRLKDAASDVSVMTNGKFEAVIGDSQAKATTVEKILVCAGPVYYDLLKHCSELGVENKVAIIRMERLYPMPDKQLLTEIKLYKKAKELRWVQEESYNQGAWLQIKEDLENIANQAKLNLDSATRPRSAAPACGYTTIHSAQLKQLMQDAFA